MNPTLATPKERFRASNTRISNHRDLVATEPFEKGSDAAMLQYMAILSQGVRDANTALAAGYRLQGAFEMLHTLKNISEEPPKVSAERSPSNLNHEV